MTHPRPDPILPVPDFQIQDPHPIARRLWASLGSLASGLVLAGAAVLASRMDAGPAPVRVARREIILDLTLPQAPVPAPAAAPRPAAGPATGAPAPRPEPVPEQPPAALPAVAQAVPAPPAPRPEAGPAHPGAAGGGAAATGAPGGLAVIQPRFDAAYLNNPAPAYPARARRAREEGRVLLRVLVSAEGAPLQVEVRASSGSAALDQAAAATVRAWRFTPARLGEAPVQAWVLVPIEFSLSA